MKLIYLLIFFLVAPIIIWGGVLLIACLPSWVIISSCSFLMICVMISIYDK